MFIGVNDKTTVLVLSGRTFIRLFYRAFCICFFCACFDSILSFALQFGCNIRFVCTATVELFSLSGLLKTQFRADHLQLTPLT